ncbi:hypothetical protein MRX96_053591, partial [Rhipicephalus microplus]
MKKLCVVLAVVLLCSAMLADAQRGGGGTKCG